MELLKYKIVAPSPLNFYINRKRLLDLFGNINISGVLIIAPAGYGKTALVSQFFDNLPRNMKCWLDLDFEDSESVRFINYFIGVLSLQIKHFASSRILDKLNEIDAGLDDIVQDLILYFDQYKGPPIWFTLDNWERVNDNKEICGFIDKLISIPNSRLIIILNSRVKPKLHYQRSLESDHLIIITKDDLRFTRDELSAAIERRTGITLGKRRLEEFYELTKGWCIISGLLKDQISDNDLLSDFNKFTDTDELEDYLLQEMFSNLKSEFYNFLIQCSLLDILSPKSCQFVISDQKTIKQFLGQITHSNLPYSVVDKNGIRLHPLVKNSLSETLKRTYEESSRKSIYHKAVNYYMKIGEVDIAIELLFDIEAYEKAFFAIKNNWHILMSQNKLEKINDWLNRTPESFHGLPDYLMVFSDYHAERGNFKIIADKVDPVLKSKLLENGSDALGILWSRYYKCIGLMEKRNHYDRFVSAWKKFNQIRGPFSKTVKMDVHDMLCFVAYNEFKFDKTLFHSKKALSYTNVNDIHHRNWYYAQIQLGAHLQGNSQKAIKSYFKLISEVKERRQGKFPIHLASYLVVILTEMGLYQKALDVIRQGREAMEEFKFFEEFIRFTLDRCEGICLFYLGNISQGLNLLERALRRAESSLPPFHSTSAIIYNYYKMLANMPVDYSIIPKYQNKPVIRDELFYASIFQSFRLINEGRYPQARKWMKQIKNVVLENNTTPWIMIISFWEAYLNEKSGNRKPVKGQVERGIRIFDRIAWSSFPMINSELISFLLPISIIWNFKINNLNRLKRLVNHHALKNSMEYFLMKKSLTDEQRARLVSWAAESKIGGLAQAVNEFVHSNNRQLHMSSKKYIDSCDKFPLPPMIINTLGEYSINIDGRIVTFKRRKAKLLFSFLLTNYPHPSHEEKLIDMCFTGKNISRPISNIRTIVSSIRKSLLGDSDVSDSYLEYANNMYSLKIPEQSKIDFMEIDRLHRRLMDRTQRVLTYPADDIPKIKSVLDLYKGDFLPEYRFEEFAAIAGEKIRGKYFGLLMLLLEYLLKNRDYAVAEKYVMEGLEKDPLWNEGIRLAIRLFHRSGQSIKAIKLYRNYEKCLNHELGIKPSKEIQMLYEKTLA